MNNISLDKLRTLAAAVAEAEQGSKAWDKATDALSAKFSPRCLVTLVDRLQSALRDAQQLEAELKRRDDAVPDDLIVDDGCSQFIGGVQQSDRLNCVWPVGTKFYAATTAAVLPTDIVITAEVARVGGLILKECEGEFMDDAARRVFNAMLAAATAAGGVDGDKS